MPNEIRAARDSGVAPLWDRLRMLRTVSSAVAPAYTAATDAQAASSRAAQLGSQIGAGAAPTMFEEAAASTCPHCAAQEQANSYTSVVLLNGLLNRLPVALFHSSEFSVTLAFCGTPAEKSEYI